MSCGRIAVLEKLLITVEPFNTVGRLVSHIVNCADVNPPCGLRNIAIFCSVAVDDAMLVVIRGISLLLLYQKGYNLIEGSE